MPAALHDISFTAPSATSFSTEARFISTISPEFGVSGYISQDSGRASGAWFSANDPVAFPFALQAAATVIQMGWMNGSSAGDNADLGIYDASWNRLVSTGSTVCSGASVWQFVNVTDTLLPLGRYYLAFARDTTTANRTMSWAPAASSATLTAFAGGYDSATDAFPLPNPLTNMAAAATCTQIPIMAFLTRTPF